MTKEAFYSFFKTIPKAELHLHLEAVISKGTIRRFYLRRHPELTSEQADAEIQTNLFSYSDLDGFIKSFIEIQNLYDSPADFDYVFADLRDYLVRNGIVYAEVFVAPSAFIKKGFAFSELVEIFHRNIEKIKKETGITVRLLVDVSRTFGAENAEQNLQLVLENRSSDIIGIGLGGSEIKGPANLFGDVFKKARDNGLATVAHAGEDVGPESVWDTIDILHASRIGHGISSVQDERLMQTLAERKIPLEICITSNVFTKRYVKQISSHPVHTFFDKGIIITLNSDDPLFFGSELLNEYWNAYSELKFSLEELKQIVQNSFTASFMTESEKKKFLSDVDSAWKKRKAESVPKHKAETTQKRKNTDFRKFFMQVAVIFTLIFVVASAVVIRMSARRTFERTASEDLAQVQQNMILRFEEGFNEQLSLALQMAKSPLIVRYFENPADTTRRADAFAEVAAYQDSFLSKLSFMINDIDLRYYANGEELYVMDKTAPSSAWYVGIMQTKKPYEFNVDYDIGLKQTFLWLNCVVRNAEGDSLGLIGTGIPLTGFIETMYSHLPKNCTMYLYNTALETTGSTELRHIEEKTPITQVVPAFEGRNAELLGTESRFVSRGKFVYAISPLGDIGWNILLSREYSTSAFFTDAALPFAVSLVLFVIFGGGFLLFFRIYSLRLTGRTAGSTLRDEIQNLMVSTTENSATSQEQSAAVKEIVVTMEDNTALSENISQKIKDVASVAGKTRGNVSEGIALLSENVQQMREIAKANEQTIEGIKSLGGKIENIWDIVSLINSVADQAKIIAFNAELEASSAGEAGKNFHIVASEIRRLADGIIDGTKEIKQQITEIQESSDRLILASESGTEKIKAGVTGAQTLSARFDSIQMASDITADSAGDITTIIQQQAQASEQILITLKQIAFGVENFSQATEQISASVAKLDTIASELNK
ncbi:MAG: adenosine deaminase [Treponema sp.]|nr:adenosine deaminase [Treponema sp.]